MDEANKLQENIATKSPGDTVTMEIWRDGEKIIRDILLQGIEDTPAWIAGNDGPQSGGEWNTEEDGKDPSRHGGVSFQSFELGFRVMALAMPEDHTRYDLIISNVKEDSEAWNRGLREGNMITEVNHQKVEELSALKDLIEGSLEEKNSVLLTIERDDNSIGYYELKNE